MKLPALAVLFSAGLQAQTNIPPGQLRPGQAISVIVCVPTTETETGWCSLVGFDPSIELDRSGPSPRLKSVIAFAPPPIQFGKVIHKLSAAQTAFPASFPGFVEGSLDVYRNGVLMAAGEDYTMGGTVVAPTVLFLPRQTPQPGDIVTLKYAWQ